MRYASFIVGMMAFLFCWIATPLCRELFLRLNLVDRPDGMRKLHSRPIPRIGGIAIVLSYAAAMGAMFALEPLWPKIYFHRPLLLSILPAAAIVFIVGVLDDIIGLRPVHKMAGQLAASGLAVALGVHMHLFTGAPLAHSLTLIASVIWLVSCTNAFNLIDGLDGLATGLGLLTTLAVLLSALLQGNTGLALIALPLAGCLLAFLRYNFSPASVFLGDCGSMTIGFLLGCFGLVWSQHEVGAWGLAAPAMAMSVPLIDVGVAVVRRVLSSRPVFEADRGHIHHRLLAKGFDTPTVALLLYGICAIAASLSLLESVASLGLRVFVLILFCVLAFYGIRSLGYAEFRLARKILSRKVFLRHLRDELYLHDLHTSLDAALTAAACWEVVRAACCELRFDSIRMCLQGEVFEEMDRQPASNYTWDFTIELGAGSYLQLARVGEPDSPRLTMSVLQTLQQSILAKQLNRSEAVIVEPLTMTVEDAEILA